MIYDFSILSGYELSGVDVAQGRRNKYFRHAGIDVKYIFTEVPLQESIERYKELGLKEDQMLCVQAYMIGEYDLSGKVLADNWILNFQKMEPDITIEKNSKEIQLNVNGKKSIVLLLREDGKSFYAINYYDNERLISQDFYLDRLVWSIHYITDSKNGCLYAKKSRTVFYTKDGNICYEWIDGIESYQFANGEILSKTEFMQRFLEKINFTEDDIILIDRPMMNDFVQPLFKLQLKASIYVFLHSGHYFFPDEEPTAVYWNREYYYYFKHAAQLKGFIVSSEEQKLDLKNDLKKENLFCPEIYVIPVCGIESIDKPIKSRIPYSIVTASRLHDRKQIDLMIRAVVLAHQKIQEIIFDLYGSGKQDYLNYLNQIVKEANAQDYIHFMGQQQMKDKYSNYEMFITASKWETLGLSMMEALSSGLSIIGWNVRYGNHIFIRNNVNGKLVDISLDELNGSDSYNTSVQKMAMAIVEVFSDRRKLKMFEQNSYRIAEGFLDTEIEKAWLKFFDEVKIR